MNNIIFYLQHRWMVVARVLYFILSLAIILVLVYERSPTTKVVPPPQPTVDINLINQSIANLEQEMSVQIKNQMDVIKKLDTKIDEQKTTIVNLDKRLQVQLEFNKRICEYIWVITIEKKLVPRKCTPDYNWTKEIER